MSTARARLMRRARHYLSVWQVNIGLDNRAGLTDINSDAEDFCCGLLNKMMDAQLLNLNLEKMNFAAVDLGDRERKFCVQVTSTAGSEKIDRTLDRFFKNDLNQVYNRLIVLVLGQKQNHRKTFKVEDGFSFVPERDVWDIPKLITQLAALDMPHLERVDAYLEEQLGTVGELTAPMDLPVLSALDDLSFLGREAELLEITRRFEGNEQVVFLSGLGGMGKTELAARFALTRWGGESYFVSYTKNWRQTVLENIALNIPNLNRESKDENKIYREAMSVLKDRSAEELLILDNVDQQEASLTQIKRELSTFRMRVLVTTRAEFSRAIDVAALRREELYRLFELHGAETTEKEKDALISAVDGHTLTVDLMARALRPGRRAATAEKLLKNLSDSSVKKVDTAYPGGEKQARINEHLRAVFQVAGLSGEEKYLLRCATLLPRDGMGDDLFMMPFADEMQDILDGLIDKGWLFWKDELLKVHPVIRLVCREELEPTDENCRDFLMSISNQFCPEPYSKERYQQYRGLFEQAAKMLEDVNGDWARREAFFIGVLWIKEGKHPFSDTLENAMELEQVGCLMKEHGDLRGAIECYLEALRMRNKLLAKNDEEVIRTMEMLAVLYAMNGMNMKAIKYLGQVLTIQMRYLTNDHPDIVRVSTMIGMAYSDFGDYSQALKYLNSALTIIDLAKDKDCYDGGQCNSAIAVTYARMGNFEKAREYIKRAGVEKYREIYQKIELFMKSRELGMNLPNPFK